jgi:hypothetical protein
MPFHAGPATALALAAALAAGCGSAVGTISGKVTTPSGKPLACGKITFLSEVGNRDPFSTDIKDGQYRIEGVPAGPAQVIVQPQSSAGAGRLKGDGNRDTLPPGKRGPADGANEVPEKYHDARKSGLKLTVQGGENTFNVDLKR